MMKKALLALFVLLASGCSQEQAGKVAPSKTQESIAKTEITGEQQKPAESAQLKEITVPATSEKPGNQAVVVVIETSKGDITLELDKEKAPKTVENFLMYINEGFYDGTIFHRVIKRFMIQGGGYDQSYDKRETRGPILNEADNGLKNNRGTVSMARTGDPHSATAQFFINHKDNAALDHRNKGAGWGYAVFGHVVKGMDVVDAIAAVKTGRGGPFPKDAPQEMVVINKISQVN
jgi:peptidyl-prolyl cis-trans isomerase B (cyclophilin B)